ncbi:MAG: hypothetical protein LBQ12_11930 [Deltaproteobacteria bacterium]|jgi:hypothetical protein|nr:hypothetical protein [Deltaproteobacteria bacterium]
MPSDSLFLALALAGIAAAMFFRGERGGSVPLLARARSLRGWQDEISFVARFADMFL